MLKVWNTYSISFRGKITAIKMNILPKLLYLFRALPINPTKTSLDSFQVISLFGQRIALVFPIKSYTDLTVQAVLASLTFGHTIWLSALLN